MRTRRATALIIAAVGVTFLLGACGGGGSKTASSTTAPKAAAARLVLPEGFLRHSFDKADANHDGFVTASEKDAMVNADYAAMDVNHDGAVTVDDIKTEVAASKAKPGADKALDQHLSFDFDHNGRIDLAEYQRHVTERFGSMDANNDQKYTWQEVLAFYTRKGSRPATTTTKAGVFSDWMAALVLVPFALGGRLRRAAVVAGTIAVVVVAMAVPAGASAVYNDANQAYEISFSCGIFCGNQWNVTNQSPNNWDSYPGESGMYYVNQDPNVGCEVTSEDNQASVTDHGWSVLNSTGSSQTDLSWSDFNDNGGTIANVNVVLSFNQCTPVT